MVILGKPDEMNLSKLISGTESYFHQRMTIVHDCNIMMILKRLYCEDFCLDSSHKNCSLNNRISWSLYKKVLTYCYKQSCPKHFYTYGYKPHAGCLMMRDTTRMQYQRSVRGFAHQCTGALIWIKQRTLHATYRLTKIAWQLQGVPYSTYRHNTTTTLPHLRGKVSKKVIITWF